jgi:hypothetical protein
MPFSFNARTTVRSVEPARSNRRGWALLGGICLLAACVFLLWLNFSFARYAVTGFRWVETDGTVVTRHRTSAPTIHFSARDGASYNFSEDYYLICRRSLCFVRNFQPGQVVPVIYDPSVPERAFVHDWALSVGVFNWFAAAVIGAFFALGIFLLLTKKPINFSVRVSGGSRLE